MFSYRDHISPVYTPEGPQMKINVTSLCPGHHCRPGLWLSPGSQKLAKLDQSELVGQKTVLLGPAVPTWAEDHGL